MLVKFPSKIFSWINGEEFVNNKSYKIQPTGSSIWQPVNSSGVDTYKIVLFVYVFMVILY